MTNQQAPAPAGEYPPLPEPRHRGPAATGSYFDAFTADQMRAYVDADRDMRAKAAPIAPKATPVPVVEQEELREGASYESMNLAVMVLSDCGHSSNYKPLLERVAGRIDRHVERLLTAQHADRAMRAKAAPEDIRSILVRCREFIDTTKIPAYPAGADLADEIDALLAAQAAPAAQGDAEDAAMFTAQHQFLEWNREQGADRPICGGVEYTVFKKAMDLYRAARSKAKEGGA